jgi:hypothetical protein
VPEVLLSGHHRAVAEWRLAAALAKTLDRRPEMLAELDPAVRASLGALKRPADPGEPDGQAGPLFEKSRRKAPG